MTDPVLPPGYYLVQQGNCTPRVLRLHAQDGWLNEDTDPCGDPRDFGFTLTPLPPVPPVVALPKLAAYTDPCHMTTQERRDSEWIAALKAAGITIAGQDGGGA